MAVKKGVAQWPPPSVLEELPETAQFSPGRRPPFSRNSAQLSHRPNVAERVGRSRHNHAPIAGLGKRGYPKKHLEMAAPTLTTRQRGLPPAHFLPYGRQDLHITTCGIFGFRCVARIWLWSPICTARQGQSCHGRLAPGNGSLTGTLAERVGEPETPAKVWRSIG